MLSVHSAVLHGMGSDGQAAVQIWFQQRLYKDFLVKIDLQRSFEADVWIKKQKEKSANAEAGTPQNGQ